MDDRIIVGGSFLRWYISALFLAATILAVFSYSAYAVNPNQLEFKSPGNAFNALVNAADSNNTKELLDILGPESKDIISSGDAVADTESRERFVRAAGEGVRFKKLNEKTCLVLIGKDGWTFPIPLIRSGKSWTFYSEEGKEEIINRRIGRNEINTIQTSLAYVEAQREYAKKTRDDGSILQYAQRFVSHRGSRDGLYWPGSEESPLGPLFARASGEGNVAGEAEKPVPYYGYSFNILKSQGNHAPGGAMDYVVNSRMTAGFGLVAYPSRYGVSGIMTFIVNQQGIVYEKDLGPGTEELAKQITAYDPDQTWKKVELTGVALSK